MPTKVRAANSSAVVEIADELVVRYVAQGWSVIAAKAAPKIEPEPDLEARRGPGRPPKSDK